jgi:hypothetical protein
VTDITDLLGQVTSLYHALTAARMEAANLRAAISAALGAADDGESDPLGYLKDELAAPGQFTDITIPGPFTGTADEIFPGGEWCL